MKIFVSSSSDDDDTPKETRKKTSFRGGTGGKRSSKLFTNTNSPVSLTQRSLSRSVSGEEDEGSEEIEKR